MQNIGWKLILIVAVVGACLWSAYPPEQKIRLGKDLRGGTSLIYLVNIPEGADDKQAILSQTIQVLKERVNPTGVLDISMQPLGADRIEIVMPLPNDAVKGLRTQYENALKALGQLAEVKTIDLDEALRFNQAVQRFGGDGTSERAKKIASLQESYNKLQSAVQALTEARTAGVEGEQLNKMEQAAADSQFEFDQLRDTVRKTSLDQSRVVRTLNLSTKSTKPEPGATAPTESPRDIAIKNLKAEFPHLSEQLDTTLAAFDAYQAKRTTLDDPEDLIRLLRGAGVLEFHIAVRSSDSAGVPVQQLRDQLKEIGPDKTDSPIARWFPVNELKQWYKTPDQLKALEADPESYFAGSHDLVAAGSGGRFYLLLYTDSGRSMTHDADSRWTVESTFITQDELGRPAVSFRLDPSGGSMMGKLTGPHVKQPMAIVLDGQVYSAPNLNSAINNSGQIQGSFSQQELDYLTRVLAAGALGARLSEQPIAINTVGPTIGQDNLNRGLQACLWSVIAVAVFMLIYYFQAGLIANVAVAANAIIIFGVMALIDGTFTLPGLAGIALTIGTAVDANILIYERIREEIESGVGDLRHAIRLGYEKALSTIIDANVTNLIVCVVLMKTATTEVKGFALTLMIGILGTLFTALFMTRQIYTIGTEVLGWKRMPMLATAVPAVHRLLSPRLDWIGLRRVFVPMSVVLVLASWVLLGMRGVAIFDTEFRGGLTVTMRTAIDPSTTPPSHVPLKQADVERRIVEIGRKADQMPPSDAREVLREMRNADVLTIGDTTIRDGSLVATGFQVKVSLPAGIKETASFKDTIVNAIVDELGSQLEVTQPIEFAGAENTRHEQHTFPITANVLGQVIKRPQYTQDVASYRGGVVEMLDEISPPASTQDIENRIRRMRDQPDFSDVSARDVMVLGLEPADPTDSSKGYKSAAVLVYDSAIDYSKVDFEIWDARLAAREWKLTQQALNRPATFEQVSEFSSAVASTLRASAVVAVTLSLLGILVYIWIRFGSLRYSTGAVIALIHDVSIGLGALALSQMIGETAFGKALLLEPFHIDLGVVAAILTLIGYSLNDTIVVLDRIRENRGKLTIPTAETVNKSINQTFSRTMLTSFTMIISLFILYVIGGTGIRAFSFVMLVGMIVGTYSSIAIAAPLVYKGHDADPTKREGGLLNNSKRETVSVPV